MYKLLIGLSVAVAATCYTSMKFKQAYTEQVRLEQKQRGEKEREERERRERKAEAERLQQEREELEQKKRELARLEEEQQEAEQRRKARQRALEVAEQRKRAEQIAAQLAAQRQLQQKQQQQRIEAAEQQWHRDEIIDFDARFRRYVLSRKQNEKNQRLALDHDWKKVAPNVQEALNNKELSSRGEKLSAEQRTTAKLDALSLQLNAAIGAGQWGEAERLYGIASSEWKKVAH